jgi:glutathionylspermidine synthase
MNTLQVLKFAKQAGLVSSDANSFNSLQGDIMHFVDLVTQEAKDEAFQAGQNNMEESINTGYHPL